MLSDFFRKRESDVVWWTEDTERVGEFLFSFDKKKIFNLFRDYPDALTADELETFNRENPYWAEFFKERLQTIA